MLSEVMYITHFLQNNLGKAIRGLSFLNVKHTLCCMEGGDI